MKYSEVFSALASLTYRGVAVPVAYAAFTNAVDTPFITYRAVDRDDFVADDRNYRPFVIIDVELYADGKDPLLEAAVESVLASLGVVYDATEAYIADERMCMTTYSFKVPLEAEEGDEEDG